MSDMAPPPAPPAPQWAPPPAPPTAPPMSGRPGPVNDTSKIVAALSLVIWPVALFAILAEPYKGEKFVKHHAIQGLGLGLVLTIVSWVLSSVFSMMFFSLSTIALIGMFSSLIGLVDLVIGIFVIIQAIKVYNGEYVELPVVYGFVKSYIGE